MEIIATNAYVTHPFLYITHKDVTISMPTGTLFRPTMANSMPRLLHYVNWFFSHLPEARQEKIFSIYERAEKLLRVLPNGEINTGDMPAVNEDMRELLADLLNELPAKELFAWFSPADMYPWPAANELPRSYAQAVSTKYPEEKTYIFREYQELFTLIMQLRAVTPILAAYLNKYNGAFSTINRDMILVSLLEESEFDQTPAFLRLQAYVNAWVGGKTDTTEAGVMRSISSDEYPRWLLCNVLIKKLSIQSFDSPQTNDASPFVIKHLSNHIRERLNKNDADFKNPERKRIFNKDQPGAGDDQRSVYEGNRIKQPVGNGERWLIQIYCEDPYRLLKSLEPEMDISIARRIFDKFNYGEYIPSNEQLLIAMWVISPSISPRADKDLTRLNAAMICSVAAAVLWHRKHYTVAAFLSSNKGQTVTRAGMINPSSIRYAKDIYPEIDRLFYFADKLKGATAVRTVVVNLVVEAEKHQWHPCLPPDMIEIARSAIIDSNSANLMISSDNKNPVMNIQQALASAVMYVIIDLAKRPLPMKAWDKATLIAQSMNLPTVPVLWEPIIPEERLIQKPAF